MTTITGKDGACSFGTNHPTVIAAMLINTLKNQQLTEELIVGNLDGVKRLAELQRCDGVGFLQVMIAHPQIDEVKMLPLVCKAASDATGLPLYIDSTNIEAIQRTLDVFEYKPVFSVSADRNRLEPMLGLVRESQAAVICLCMDDNGIPSTASGRLQIADRIVKQALTMGILEDDLVIDPLVMAVGVSPPDSMQVTLETLQKVKSDSPYATFLGIDNAGFGMPNKNLIDLAFLMGVIPAGLDAALIEPPLLNDVGRSGVTLFYASNFISGRDPYAREYLNYHRKNDLIPRKQR